MRTGNWSPENFSTKRKKRPNRRITSNYCRPMTEQQIEPQPWMTSPKTRAVLDALAAGGVGVRYVGGCVRDAAIGRKISDIDLATDAPPERVMEVLEEAGLKVIPTGLAHGTVTAVSGGAPYEITTLRHDVETDGRRAVVAFTDDWEADAARRDFTMNALSLEARRPVARPVRRDRGLARGPSPFRRRPAPAADRGRAKAVALFPVFTPITASRRRIAKRWRPAARWPICCRACRRNGCGSSS